MGKLAREDLREFLACSNVGNGIEDCFPLQPGFDAPGVLVVCAIACKGSLPSFRPEEAVAWLVKIGGTQLDPLWIAPAFATRFFKEAIWYIVKAEVFPECCTSFGRKWC